MKASTRIPEIGDAVPRRWSRPARALAGLGLRTRGWGFEGSFPDLAKAIYIAVPHTSNWDFLIAISVVFALGLRISFLGKHTLFDWPLGVLMRWLGGIPVDRGAPVDVVAQAAERFRSSEKLLLVLSPEGTRKHVQRWKTGFHRIALRAGVAIVPVSLDYSRKLIRFGPPLQPSGDLAADLEELQGFFEGSIGKRFTDESAASGDSVQAPAPEPGARESAARSGTVGSR